MKINILGVVKNVAELAVSASVGVVVGNFVRATTPYDSGKVQKIMVGIGSYAVTGVLGDLSAKYITGQIDEYAARVKDIFHPEVEEEPVETFEEVTLTQNGELEEPKEDQKTSDDK
jgi:hypothetical protein